MNDPIEGALRLSIKLLPDLIERSNLGQFSEAARIARIRFCTMLFNFSHRHVGYCFVRFRAERSYGSTLACAIIGVYVRMYVCVRGYKCVRV